MKYKTTQNQQLVQPRSKMLLTILLKNLKIKVLMVVKRMKQNSRSLKTKNAYEKKVMIGKMEIRKTWEN